MDPTHRQALPDFERVSRDLIHAASKFSASILADVAGRRSTMHGRIQPLSPEMRLAGPALTVEVRPGDNLMIHAAIHVAQPGDVLVIDGKGDRTCALLGSIMMNAITKRGLGGVIVDGSVRDGDALRRLGVPVYAVGMNPNGPTKRLPGRVNQPISCGNAVVNPGDLVVADGDGVVVIERARVADLLRIAERVTEEERSRISAIWAGPDMKAEWLNDALVAAGVLGEGESWS